MNPIQTKELEGLADAMSDLLAKLSRLSDEIDVDGASADELRKVRQEVFSAAERTREVVRTHRRVAHKAWTGPK